MISKSWPLAESALTGKVAGQGRGRFRGMLRIEWDDVPSAIRSLEFSLGMMHHRAEFLTRKAFGVEESR